MGKMWTSMCTCRPEPSRRVVTLGLASTVISSCLPAQGAEGGLAGCLFLQAGCSFSARSAQTFPDLGKMDDNASLGIGAIGVELMQLFQLMANPAFYDDSNGGPEGNAGASLNALFPQLPAMPKSEGTIAFGRKCYSRLGGGSALALDHANSSGVAASPALTGFISM